MHDHPSKEEKTYEPSQVNNGNQEGGAAMEWKKIIAIIREKHRDLDFPGTGESAIHRHRQIMPPNPLTI